MSPKERWMVTEKNQNSSHSQEVRAVVFEEGRGKSLAGRSNLG